MTPRRSSRLNLTSTELNLTLTSNGGVKRPRRADNTSKSPENPNEKDYSPKPKRAKTEEVVRTPKKALNGEAKHSGEVDNHNNTAENPKRTASQLEKASTPKSNYAKTEIGVEKSPSKVRRSLQMQVSENAVHSNGHKREEVQAEKGSCNGAKNYMYDESLDKQGHYTVCHQQPNGNGNTRTPKKVLSGGSKQSGQVDNHSKTPVNSNGNELLSEKAHTPKSIYAKTKLAVEKSPSKARRSLNMQSTENDVYSNGHKTEEMQAGKGSCNDAHARNGMFEESVDKQCHYTVCDQQANGNGSIRTPKKGACREPDALRTPKSPRKKANNLPNQIQKWNPKDSSQILAVKAALHLSAVPTTVICREEELKKVFEFCKMCIEKKKVGSMYVCGCPGTGKSLLLEKVKFLSIEWAKEVGMPPPTSVVVNCTSLTNTSDIFSKILEQCQGKKKCSVNSSPFQELKNFLCEKKQSSAKKMMLLIIDEMDYLISKDQAVLYDLFRLPTFPNSHCMLIGISNAIDLTDRFLPKLQSLNCEPLVMTFRAYSKEQILKILQQRLMDLPCQIFQLEALELCARKVAAASGDMRKALHVCRGAVEMLEAELTSGIHELDDIPHEKSMTNGLNLPPERLTKQEINVVRIDHMARALAKTFRSAVVDTIQTLPRHQQIVLCSAVKFFRRRKKDATLGELNVAYLDFCKTTSMYPLTGPEFSSMCRVLSDQALLNLGQSREDRLRRVTLRVDEGDVNFALQGIRFFRNCLQ